MESFDLTQRTIFGCLAHNLFGVPFEPDACVDWEAVFRESISQSVTMQVFMNCGEIPGISGELKAEIQKYLFKAMLGNIRVHDHHTQLHRLLTAKGIPYVTLKGAASARYYPDPQSRAMGDVDFYVSKSDFDRTLEIFKQDGFTAGSLDHISHVVLKKKPMHLEMHHTPAGVPDGEVGERIRRYLEDLLEDARLVEGKSAVCFCPSDFHHGLIMLMHLQHHLLAEGVGLRHLCDWAVFVDHFRGNEFPELFREKLKAVGLWRLARLLTIVSSLYLGLPEQEWARGSGKDEETARALLCDILEGGNFGKKDHQRAYEGMFISDRGKNGVKDNRLSMAMKMVNRITLQKYPFFRRCPVLLPVGWLMAIAGYLLRNRKRRQRGIRIDTMDAYQKSAPRIRLYQRLKLYEPEK